MNDDKAAAHELDSLAEDSKIAIRVTDDAMSDCHIVSGDYVIIDTTRVPAPGEVHLNGKLMAVRADDGEVIVRRYYWRSSPASVCLESGNREYPPLVRGRVEVLGVVSGVVRRY